MDLFCQTQYPLATYGYRALKPRVVQTEMWWVYKIYNRFQRGSTKKKKVKYLNIFLHWLHVKMTLLVILSKYIIWINFTSSFFTSFKVTTRKLKTDYVALICGSHHISIKLGCGVLDTKFHKMSVSPPQCTIKLLQRSELLAMLFHGHVLGGNIVDMSIYMHIHTFTHAYFMNTEKILFTLIYLYLPNAYIFAVFQIN